MATDKELSLLTADCPRCGVKMLTFDVLSASSIPDDEYLRPFEAFCRCRRCGRPTVFSMEGKYTDTSPTGESLRGMPINWAFNNIRVAPAVFPDAAECPEHVPDALKAIFDEAARCLATDCFDASGTMFRKVLDQSTRSLVTVEPQSVEKSHANYISWKEAKDLRLRLNWLFSRNLLPTGLVDLVSCVHQDGNDAAHSTETIGREGAIDLQDFTTSILETLYTAPGKIAANVARREKRRGGSSD